MGIETEIEGKKMEKERRREKRERERNLLPGACRRTSRMEQNTGKMSMVAEVLSLFKNLALTL